MQAYSNKIRTVHWDTLNINYPVRKFPETGLTSEKIAHQPRSIPETLKDLKKPLQEEINYSRNYNITKDLTKSQYTVDYGPKQAERKRCNKHTSCVENLYIYPPHRKLSERPPNINAHFESETRSSFVRPSLPSRLKSFQDAFIDPALLPTDLASKHTSCVENLYIYPPQRESPIEPIHNKFEPMDTTNEGFEKYLDPYVTTSRLHHRPFTAEQLSRVSNTKDVMTYYTYSDIPWVRSPKPNVEKGRLPLNRPKSMYNRETFKGDFREIRTHNKLHWTPGSFRTETRDNYKNCLSRPESNIHNFEDDVRSYFKHATAHSQTNIQEEHSTLKKYLTENSIIGSGKPVCSVFDQFVERNKRLASKEV